MAECATGTALGQAQAPPSIGPRYVRLRHPLIEIGWTRRDCAAFLAHHELPAELDLACVACPMRSNRSWRHLRENDPAAFAEAVAVDVALRHGHPNSARRGMPPGTTYYLHPDRVPLDQVDLIEPNGSEPNACTPWTCRGNGSGDSEQSGMPSRGTYYLHASRRPLAEVDLGIDNGPEPEGCSPWSCRGDTAQEPVQDGDAQ